MSGLAFAPSVVGAMTAADIWVFLLLGIGTGAAYAIAGVGLVQIYRGSGVINFAHGGIAFLSVALYGQFSVIWDWPWPVAFALSLAAAVAAGALIQLLVMRPAAAGHGAGQDHRHRRRPGRRRGGGAAGPRQHHPDRPERRPLGPVGRHHLQPGAVLGFDRLIMTGAAVAIGGGLWWLMGATRFGLETTAVAEDEVVAQALRVDPDRVALVNWTLGGGLAGLAGLLWSSWTGLRVEPYILLVVPALAAALIGRFDSFPITVAGGIGLGMVRELIFRWQTDPDIGLPTGFNQGWNEAVPFVVIIVLLAMRGSVFPDRGEATSALPVVGRARLSPSRAAMLVVVAPALTLLATEDLALAITATSGVAVVGLSLVVVTGLAGQVSLAQMAMAGVGALVAAQLSSRAGVPFLLLLPIAAVVGAGAGALFALPALRTRGPALAVATIALGLAVQRTVFGNPSISGASFSGLEIDAPNLFGWSIEGVFHPARFAAVSVAVLIIALLAVSNLRAGPIGRRFLAVRSNERAAAALGISVSATKVAAFVISAAIAAVGGIVLTFNRSFVQVIGVFNFGESLLVLVLTLIGGIGFLLGPVVGGALSPAGLVPWVFNEIDAIERLLIVVAGAIVVVQLIVAPNGIVNDVTRRQADMGDLRRAVGIDRSRWRAIGWAEIAGGVGVLTGVVGGRFDTDVPVVELRAIALVALLALLVLAIARHRRRGHPLAAQLPAIVVLLATVVAIGTPRLLSPLLDAPADRGPAFAPGLWLGLGALSVLVAAVVVDRRRDRATQPRVPLRRLLVLLAVGVVALTATFELEILTNLFGLLTGVLFIVFGSGKVRREEGGSDERPSPTIEPAIEPPDASATRPSAALRIQGLTVRYGSVVAVNGLDLDVEPGRVVGLIGPNGAGKTSAIDAICGFVAAERGTVLLGADELTGLAVHRRSRLGLGRTFQTVEPFDDLTVVENLAAATERIGWSDWLLAPARVPALQLSASTAQVIEAFELGDELGSLPGELSQGHRRLLGVARAMAGSPSVLLLDEPAAGLDAVETDRLGAILRRAARDLDVGMLVVEHDMSLVSAICDHVVALDFGRTIATGPPELVLADDAVRRAYLGEQDEAAAARPPELAR